MTLRQRSPMKTPETPRGFWLTVGRFGGILREALTRFPPCLAGCQYDGPTCLQGGERKQKERDTPHMQRVQNEKTQ
jgi:hypothetical protein